MSSFFLWHRKATVQANAEYLRASTGSEESAKHGAITWGVSSLTIEYISKNISRISTGTHVLPLLHACYSSPELELGIISH